MDRPLLIAFAGGQGVGKTSLANYAKEKYGGEVLSFATPLKVELYDLLKSVGENDGDTGALRLGMEVVSNLPLPSYSPRLQPEHVKLSWVSENKAALRYAMQRLGDYRRVEHPSYFVGKLLDQVEEMLFRDCTQLYVDDCRFENEALALADIGFHVVKVECDEEIAASRSKARDGSYDPNTRSHQSETETQNLPYNYFLDNSGPYEKSTAQVDDIVNQIRCAD
jgi:hypothetical protein